jgi:hypothetical protein
MTEQAVATVRVNLITFHRPNLLPRAVESLRQQTFTNWVCEIQNGDPTDEFPGRLIAELNDPRFTLRPSGRRTGPVEAFNLAHTPAREPYQSILEDDNWWEPCFLEVMLAEIARQPTASLAWANMRVWRELPSNQWEDTATCVWSRAHWTEPRLFHWPQLVHFSEILYSNGAMLLRSSAAAGLIMPPDTPRDMIEHTRERLMRYPILLVPQPLANFALTCQTFRSTDYQGWGKSQALLGASFLLQVPMTGAARRHLWAYRRKLRPRSTSNLFFSALLAGDRSMLRLANVADWLNFIAACTHHPRVAWAILRARQYHRSFWEFLNRCTAERTAEARARGFAVLGDDTLLDKQRPAVREPAA